MGRMSIAAQLSESRATSQASAWSDEYEAENPNIIRDPAASAKIYLDKLIGSKMLIKSTSTGIARTSELLRGCSHVGLYISRPRCDNAFLPLLRAFYLHAMRMSERDFCQAFDMIAVNANKSEAEFEAQFSSLGVCWPAVPYPRSQLIAEMLQRDLELDDGLPYLVVVDIVTKQVVAVNGVAQVRNAMMSQEPMEAIKKLLQVWGLKLRPKLRSEPRRVPSCSFAVSKLVKAVSEKASQACTKATGRLSWAKS
ncbi:unnamed protein product [Chrysoparadoxa australica]